MRVSTSQLFDRSVQNILRNQSELSDLQQQLASGKKILRPSDDPVGSAKVIRLTEQIEQIEQYQRNNDIVSTELEQQEAVMRNVVEVVQRAQTLTLQAGSGANGQQDRDAIAIEVGQLRDQVFDLMNTKNAAGEYIFAGYETSKPAFEFDPNATGNKYSFQGDEGVNEFQLSPTVRVEGGESGYSVFENVLARLTATDTGGGSVTGQVRITDQGSFDAFHNNQYDPVTPANNVLTVTIDNPNQVTITSPSGINDTLNVTVGNAFEYKGMEITVNGVAGDTMELQLDKPEKKNLAETLNDLANALTDDTLTDAEYRDRLADASVGLKNGFEAVGAANSAVGGRMRISDSVRGANEDLLISSKEARSTVEDVDYAEAVSQLSREETALQAAQATFSRITQLSLFDFI
ncbi:Flagellin [Saliniradius amylolyticus]|uniref:Flagellin n=1 Tax=Saliniradius amylolyticus TaxID=2183582 RepID=A0A2S2E5Q6_9ALTE|nr:flagellar hook-associated protein FlgL [Saliniradius amylolyticus]AWL12570.1 Flagellin [Saliniradius amylolyticus]